MWLSNGSENTHNDDSRVDRTTTKWKEKTQTCLANTVNRLAVCARAHARRRITGYTKDYTYTCVPLLVFLCWLRRSIVIKMSWTWTLVVWQFMFGHVSALRLDQPHTDVGRDEWKHFTLNICFCLVPTILLYRYVKLQCLLFSCFFFSFLPSILEVEKQRVENGRQQTSKREVVNKIEMN